MNARLNSLLERFAAWFCSGPGVWQTTFITLAVVVVELADRSLDPHAFVLMAVLTVYSAITQPALAYSGAQQGRRTDELLARLDAVEEATAHAVQALAGMVDQVKRLDEVHGDQLAKILDALHQTPPPAGDGPLASSPLRNLLGQ